MDQPAPCVGRCISYDGGRGCHVATSDPIAEIIGDYRAFAAMQRDRLLTRGIDITPYPLSHLAVRVADWDLYVHQRTLLEGEPRGRLERASDLQDRPRRAARCPRRRSGLAHRADPAGSPACLPDGPRAPRRRRG